MIRKFFLLAAAAAVLITGAVSAMAANPTDFDGIYAGFGTSLSSCPASAREFDMVIEGGQARLVYNAKLGTMLTGFVSSDGVVRMKGIQENYVLAMSGTIQPDGSIKLDATSVGGAAPCHYEYALKKTVAGN